MPVKGCLAIMAVFLAIGLAFADLDPRHTEPSAYRVAVLFADGISNHDYRQSCQVVAYGKGGSTYGSVAECTLSLNVGLAQVEAFYGALSLKVVPHSLKVDGDRATVKLHDSNGNDYLLQLKRRPSGWKVVDLQ